MQKLLLTGRPRCGKSSFLQNALAGLPLAGFAIQRLTTCEETWAFRLLDLSAEPYLSHLETIEDQGDIAISLASPGKWQGDTGVFEEKGCLALEKCLDSPRIAIMDELGIFEREAHKFQQTVFRLLDSDLPVLGVLKDKHTPFLDGVRAHPAVQVLPFPSPEAAGLVRDLINRWREREQ
jgi:nucleoside-triphosphatase